MNRDSERTETFPAPPAVNPTQRFTARVNDYAKARPGYPDALVQLLLGVGLHPPCALADIGSGTGILTALLLKHGYEVYAVEPNREMREAAERMLVDACSFHTVDGSAEMSNLPSACVDGVAAAQAFHWFRKDEAATEFRRILKPAGWAFLVWNTRKTDASPFMQAYEDLLQTYSVDYNRVNHRNVSREEFAAFFGTHEYRRTVISNSQTYDLERLRSGMLSASYTPQRDDPRHEPMLQQLDAIFSAHQQEGTVVYELDTEVYYGQLRP